MRTRILAGSRLLALLAIEAAAVVLLRGSPNPGAATVDWGHLGSWVANTGPDDAVVAVVRLVAMALAGWLLATTALYLLARLTRIPGLVRGTAWATLPAVRRIVDAAVAASILGGAVLSPSAAGAQVLASPPIVVDLGSTTTTAGGHLYVPVPAGDRVTPVPTTARVTVTTTRPATATTALQTAPPPPPVVAPAGHTHAVVPGDNLWTIAAAELTRQTGRTADHLAEVEIRNYWLAVIDANRDHLRSGNPNLIYPGESIVCPPAG